MGNRRPDADVSTLILEAAAIVVPLLVLGALVLHLASSGEPTARPAAAPAFAPPPASALDAGGVDSGSPSTPAASRPARGDGPSSRAPPPPATEARVPEAEPASTSGTDAPAVQVRRGESVQVFRAPGAHPLGKLGDETEFGSPTVLSVQQVRPGWIGVSTALVPAGRIGWIRADGSRLLTGSVDYAIRVDLSARQAELTRDGEVVRRWPVTVGAPGSETPVGRFAVTDTFRGGLNPAYGCCALALSTTQPNLPSGWQGGNRIAIHGTSGLLGVAASSGCVRSANRDVSALVETVPLGTPVTIRN